MCLPQNSRAFIQALDVKLKKQLEQSVFIQCAVERFSDFNFVHEHYFDSFGERKKQKKNRKKF